MKPVIVITSEGIAPSAALFLQNKGYDLRVLPDDSHETICRNVQECTGIIARDGYFDEDVFRAAPKLKVLVRHGVGLDIIDLAAASSAGVCVCNTPNSNSNSVAEHTVMLILACARHLVHADRRLRDGWWQIRTELSFQEVRGKVLGIIGFGHIGRLVAHKAALGLDMNVLYYDPYSHSDDAPSFAKRENTLYSLIKKADFLTVHVPLVQGTRHLIDQRCLESMKPGAVVINTSRGGIVDEEALFHALKENHIAAAGLDVFVDEPFSSGKLTPLFDLDNIIVTPHVASNTREALAQTALDAAQEIDRVLQGAAPLWCVNHPAGK